MIAGEACNHHPERSEGSQSFVCNVSHEGLRSAQDMEIASQSNPRATSPEGATFFWRKQTIS